jgi:hypothetical protein
LGKLCDNRTAEQRKRAIVVYDSGFALFQEWHEQIMHAANLRKLRSIFGKAA